MRINLKNTETSYGLVGRSLHWISVALLLAAVFFAGKIEVQGASDAKLDTIGIHSSIGLTLLLLLLARLYWRTTNINPVKFYKLHSWQKLVAVSLHRSIYIVLITECVIGVLLLVSGQESIRIYSLFSTVPGLLDSTAAYDLAITIHNFISILIYPLFLVHIVAAIYHQIFGVIDE